MAAILLVDDDRALVKSLGRALRDTYDVDVAFDGMTALAKSESDEYLCLVLDLVLPDASGLEICRVLRARGDMVPIIVLSGSDDETEKAALLDAGADEYVTKPVGMTELQARLRACIRRSRLAPARSSHLAAADVLLDGLRHEVTRCGEAVRLRPKEFLLLECLMHNAGRPVSRAALLDYAWEGKHDVWEKVLDVHISNLREKLDKPFGHPRIKTVYTVGYKFDTTGVK